MLVEIWLLPFALVGSLLAVYAHARLAVHTATRVQAELVRLVLLATGAAAGWLAVRWQPGDPGLSGVLAFLGGFGMVHLPAAFILWSKRQRGVYR